MFTPKLIPERVEGLVVGSMDDMTKSAERESGAVSKE